MDNYYQSQCGQYTVDSTAYSNDTSFVTVDLGNYEVYRSYPMDRVTSDFSHSSFDSAVPSDYTSPTTVGNNFEFGSCSATYPGNYSLQPSYSPATSPTSYTSISAQACIPRNNNGYQSPQMTQTPIAQSSSVQSTSKHDIWPCIHPGCKQKPFKRHADLNRHFRHVHGDPTRIERIFCDYKKCCRSEGFSSNGEDSPFSRWDHFKAHLRDFHKEPIPKRSSSSNSKDNNSKFFDGRVFSSSWWRCSKCLTKNHLRDVKGYRCGDCSHYLEPAVMEERQKRFPGEAQRCR